MQPNATRRSVLQVPPVAVVLIQGSPRSPHGSADLAHLSTATLNFLDYTYLVQEI